MILVVNKSVILVVNNNVISVVNKSVISVVSKRVISEVNKCLCLALRLYLSSDPQIQCNAVHGIVFRRINVFRRKNCGHASQQS